MLLNKKISVHRCNVLHGVCPCAGGMNTAGLGGVGGPYRLDSGNPVFQVADLEKLQVPEEVICYFCFAIVALTRSFTW